MKQDIAIIILSVVAILAPAMVFMIYLWNI